MRQREIGNQRVAKAREGTHAEMGEQSLTS